MITKYYIVVSKDKDGFKIPFIKEGELTPLLFLSPDDANKYKNSIIKEYNDKMNPVKQSGLSRFFRKEEVETVTEKKKKDMRWFIEHASIQGVLIKV